VSEQILNGTSAQLGYTRVGHAGKYRTEDGLKIQTIHKRNTTKEKQKIQNQTTMV